MRQAWILVVALTITAGTQGCRPSDSDDGKRGSHTVPREGSYGIYSFRLARERTDLLFSTDDDISTLSFDPIHGRFAFSRRATGAPTTSFEIWRMEADGQGLTRLTFNGLWDTYPSWSPDGLSLLFLRLDATLDIYWMLADGTSEQLFYDSGGHDGDVHWGPSGKVAFTRDSQIWLINDDGTSPSQLTSPPGAGTGGDPGTGKLPLGDYDPRISPDGNRVVFERCVDTTYVHNGYRIYAIDVNGTGETELTHEDGVTQGLPQWSPSGSTIVYVVAARETGGLVTPVFTVYTMNPDGSDIRELFPDSYPPVTEFGVQRDAVFGATDDVIYFIGTWW